MTNENGHPSLRVPAHDLPVPRTPSVQAQAVLGMGTQGSSQVWKATDSKASIQESIDATMAAIPAGMGGPMISAIYGTADTGRPADVEVIDVAGVPVYVGTPEGLDPGDRRVHLSIHGALVYGGGEMARVGAAITAGGLGVRTWVVDYRMPPYHPFPAPLEDCLAVYRSLLEDCRPEEIIIGGMSIGANLTLATILRARDEGLPLPAAAVINSPPADLTMSGDSTQTNAHADISYNRQDLADVFSLYTDGQDPRHPWISPVYGDYSKGFPPTILTTGTRDFLLSDTVRVHRKLRAAGVQAELHVWEAAPHIMFLGMAPEDHERTAEIRRFMQQQWALADTQQG
jgi:epsilon-lactone hydrolase